MKTANICYIDNNENEMVMTVTDQNNIRVRVACAIDDLVRKGMMVYDVVYL